MAAEKTAMYVVSACRHPRPICRRSSADYALGRKTGLSAELLRLLAS